jgi:hypothetical protein
MKTINLLEDLINVELEDIDIQDYPKFFNAYTSYDKYKEGTPLTDTELDVIIGLHYFYIAKRIINRIVTMKTINVLDLINVELEGIDMHLSDYPKFCDAFISYAEYKDGTPLTDTELDALMDQPDAMQYVNEFAHESVFN